MNARQATGNSLVVRDVSVVHVTPAGPVQALTPTNLTLEAGAVLVVTGRSGSGKSTLLAVLAGLEQPTTGSVELDGRVLVSAGGPRRSAAVAERRRRDIGLVLQADNLLPQLTVGENVAMRQSLAGRDDPPRRTRLLERLGLRELDGALPDRLSGGQRARVAVAMALVHQPSIILADEPTGPLDGANATIVIDLLLAEQRRLGAILVVVTHSPEAAARFPRMLELTSAGAHAAETVTTS